MADNVVFPRKLLKKFIALYKELPCLWDRDSPNYKVKMKRHDAVTKLTELVQEYDPSATRVHILRKIESLRACVRREFRRIVDSRSVASDETEIYKPNLWYYDSLSFIFKEEEVDYSYKKIPDSVALPRQVIVSIQSEDEEEPTDAEDHHYDNDAYATAYNVPALVEISTGSPISKRVDCEEDQSKNKRCTEIDDEYDAIGINVAAKLRNLPSNMTILAEKLINDVLFQAQINGLSPSTVISTPDPFKQENAL